MTSLAEILDLSRYLQRLNSARPGLLDEIAPRLDRPVTAQELAGWFSTAPGAAVLTEDTLKPTLRRFKQWAFARIATRDLSGRTSLAEVTEAMTAIAEEAVARALAVLMGAMEARYGVPTGVESGARQELLVLGMGKLGGRELNVSSDIDLIFVYAEDGETRAERAGQRSISNFEFFTRLGRSLINAIAEATADGQVFRVDMRLRPNGDSGPLVCSFDMLENYFIAQGREWERYAWIKARLLGATDRGQAVHDELEKVRRPFVFRKYLDYGAFNAMRSLHAQIRREVAKKDMADNVKLGPGGIREIEFIAQVFQLIRGGREWALQIRPTLSVLNLLEERGILARDVVSELVGAYDFLRRVEHRLQYLDDAQTHSLPTSPEDGRRVAKSMGYASYEAFLVELDDHRANVSRHFETVFADPTQGEHALAAVWNSAGQEGQDESFARLGYRAPAAAAQRMSAMRASPRYQQMSEDIRGRFDALAPRLIEAAAACANPDETLVRAMDLLESISRRAAYLALLQQYPQALEKLVQLLSSSSWAASYLQRHPILLDELLDPSLLDDLSDWTSFRSELTARLTQLEPDTERQMDVLREVHHIQVFRLLTQDIAGLLTVEKLADHLSELADILLDAAIDGAWKKLLRRHIERPKFAVISYGKLGGKELGYASDLDLVFLYQDEAADAAELYARLGMRMTTWLSAQTPAGQLFDTDMRLRPNGDSGLISSSIAAFCQYQFEAAWPWEHQALTRARFSAGDKQVGEAFERIRCEVLCMPRDLVKLRDDVIAMREKMIAAHATPVDERDTVFDLKHDPGGLVDVEFMVQYLVLGYANRHPELTRNLGNIALLKMAAELGLIPLDQAEAVRNAYRDYRRLQHGLRLNDARPRVAPSSMQERIDAVRRLWRTVFAG